MSSYSFQMYEAIEGLRQVEKNLKFASEYRGFAAAPDRELALRACYDHRQYLIDKFTVALDLYLQERKRNAKAQQSS